MTSFTRLVAALAVMLAGSGSCATTVRVTPATLAAVIDRARPGDVITLTPGDYARVTITGKHWAPGVGIDAHAATLATVALLDVDGLTWRGGTFDGKNTERYGFTVNSSRNIVVDGTTMRGYLRNGIGFGRDNSDARIVNNTFADMGSDGIDISMSRRIVVDNNSCEAFVPTPGAHPDCIQLWSRPDTPPVSDITITHNRMTGAMQGISLFNHVRDGVDDGGFDRITITDNDIKVMQYNGITLADCRNCVAQRNLIDGYANSPTHARMTVRGTGSVDACDNVIVLYDRFPGQERCKR